MKKLKLSLLDMKGAEILNRQQLKNVMGGSGYPGSGGQCIQCHHVDGYTSCWYSTQDAAALCERVYGGNNRGVTFLGTNCDGCTMN